MSVIEQFARGYDPVGITDVSGMVRANKMWTTLQESYREGAVVFPEIMPHSSVQHLSPELQSLKPKAVRYEQYEDPPHEPNPVMTVPPLEDIVQFASSDSDATSMTPPIAQPTTKVVVTPTSEINDPDDVFAQSSQESGDSSSDDDEFVKPTVYPGLKRVANAKPSSTPESKKAKNIAEPPESKTAVKNIAHAKGEEGGPEKVKSVAAEAEE